MVLACGIGSVLQGLGGREFRLSTLAGVRVRSMQSSISSGDGTYASSSTCGQASGFASKTRSLVNFPQRSQARRLHGVSLLLGQPPLDILHAVADSAPDFQIRRSFAWFHFSWVLPSARRRAGPRRFSQRT